MAEPIISTTELRAIDTIFNMGSGYVLDFTDRTFSEFFRDFSIRIDQPKYSAEGASKAKRLRHFLRVTPPPLSGRILAALMAYRLAISVDVDRGAWKQVAATAARLGGVPPPLGPEVAQQVKELSEAELLKRSLSPDAVAGATRDPAMAAIVVERLEEAERCIGVEAHLAAVVLSGSVLEALCLDFGTQHPERVNRAYESKYAKSSPKLDEWHLRSWIEVLGSTGDLSPDIEKFGQALRDFRNYVHPAAQLASGFRPDKHVISLRVVIAAIDDLASAHARLGRVER